MRATDPAQSLDAAPAFLARLIPQMALQRIPNAGSISGGEPAQILRRFRRQDNLITHSGYILARMGQDVNRDVRAIGLLAASRCLSRRRSRGLGGAFWAGQDRIDCEGQGPNQKHWRNL